MTATDDESGFDCVVCGRDADSRCDECGAPVCRERCLVRGFIDGVHCVGVFYTCEGVDDDETHGKAVGRTRMEDPAGGDDEEGDEEGDDDGESTGTEAVLGSLDGMPEWPPAYENAPGEGRAFNLSRSYVDTTSLPLLDEAYRSAMQRRFTEIASTNLARLPFSPVRATAPSSATPTAAEERAALEQRRAAEATARELRRERREAEREPSPPPPQSQRPRRTVTRRGSAQPRGTASTGNQRVATARRYAAEWKAIATAMVATQARSADSGTFTEIVVGAQRELAVLRDRVYLPFHYNMLFDAATDDEASANSNVLLYGPAGTGKTRLALALALTMAVPFMSVSAAELQSTYTNGTNINFKNMLASAEFAAYVDQTMYRAAHVVDATARVAPVRGGLVVLFDEADELLGAEGRDTQKSVVAEFKARVQPTRVSADRAKMVLVAATNVPSRIEDSGVLRRFAVRLYVGLPDAEDRVGVVALAVRRAYRAKLASPEVVALLADLELVASATHRDLVLHTRGYSQAELRETIVALVQSRVTADLDDTRFVVRNGVAQPVAATPTTTTGVTARRTTSVAAAAAAAATAVSAAALLDDAVARGTRIPVAYPVVTGRSIVEAFRDQRYSKRSVTPEKLRDFLAYATQMGDSESIARITQDITVASQVPH
jgi:SpoVK/Ycf46/Vps4 family AAA+-type ATPase